MNKQLPKTSGTDVLPAKKKNSEKPYGGGVGGGIPTPFYVRGLDDLRKKPALIIVGKTACPKEN